MVKNDNTGNSALGSRDAISARIAGLSPAKRALLELRMKQSETEPRRGTVIPRRDPGQPCPLSFSQQRLWFLQQFDPNSRVYNITRAIRLKGALNVEALRQALTGVVARHEVLRTHIRDADGGPVQVIADSVSMPLPVFDISDKSESEQDREIRRVIDEEAQRPFDLSSDLMLNASLVRTGLEDHVLVLATHHIASDGWSSGVLLRDLGALYGSLCQDNPSPLADLPVQYADFAVWQRGALQAEALAAQLGYWKERLQGLPDLLQLPSDRARPKVQSFRGAREPIHLSPELTKSLRKLSQRESVTPFMSLLAVFQILLFRYSGQEDLVIGVPVANRTKPELENLIGFFVNNLVLRTDLSGDPTFQELLRRVREVSLGAYAHQEVPFEKLVEELQPERTLSHTPLFQVMFGFQNARKERFELPGLTMTPLEIDSGTSKFDLFMSLSEGVDSVRGALEYNTDIFDRETITRMIGHYITMLESVCVQPECRVSLLPLMAQAERLRILSEWNDTGTSEAATVAIQRLFERQVEIAPDTVAVSFEDHRLTYRDLNARANQLARYLRKLGVDNEVLVGISMERSLDMVTAALAVLKAGGAYVPLDPSYPSDRLAYMAQDAGISVLLTQQKLLAMVPRENAKVVCVDSERSRLDQESVVNIEDPPDPNNLAYIIYTSGSTGKPKGVQIPHCAVVNFLSAMRKRPGMEPGDVLAAVTTLSFDIAGLELFLPLTCGATVVLISSAVAADGVRLAELLDRYGATVMQATPATWRMLLDAGWAGSKSLKVLCGGEMLPRDLANRLLDLSATVWNMYGPTETTIWSTTQAVERTSGPVTIGRAIDNTRIYIVDAQFNPVPIGVPGELFIGGAGVARGYRGRPELTAERFVPDPFGREPGSRLYRTGDLARFTPDGTIECLGRTDHQVKLRGFRIELGEIEAVLSQHPAVQRAIVVDREVSGDKRLVGYIVGDAGSTNAVDLKNFLRAELPEYMIPSAFVFLPSLPLTPNRKVDRSKLPAPDGLGDGAGREKLAPRDATELQLANAWEDVLGVNSIGVRDNFFELGGHSLLAVRLFSRIEKIFGRKLPLATLFQAPDVESFANLLRHEGWSPLWSSLVPIQPKGSLPPFFCVHAHGGNVLNFNDLARNLGMDQPFYGLQAQGLDGDRPKHSSVEEMAAHYITEIRSVQPSGPYFLGGYCFGGKVALEMACQLRSSGEEVALLAMIDAFAPGYPAPLPWIKKRLAQLRHHWRQLGSRRLNERLSYLNDRSRAAWKKYKIVLKKGGQKLGIQLGAGRSDEVAGRQKKPLAVRPYSGEVLYPGRITVFSPMESHSGYLEFEPHLGWNRLAAGGVDVYRVPGMVSGIIKEPYVKELARNLQACITKAALLSLQDQNHPCHESSDASRHPVSHEAG